MSWVDRVSVCHRGRVRAGLSMLMLMLMLMLIVLGCHSASQERSGGEDVAEQSPARSVEAKPTPDPAEARKRACIDDALEGAEPRFHGLIRSLCSEWVELEIPGVALAIVEADGAVFQLELGVRCFGEDAPVDGATRFRVGSISKTVTAALSMMLIADARLALTSTAGALVPGYESPADLADPTLAALLRHRSGLADIEPGHLVDLDGAWLPALARSAVAGAPGDYHYSNTGYSLVGAMLEVASERDYEVLVAERIAAPLGLDSFTADAKRTPPETMACGHLAHDQDRHPILVSEDLDFMPGDPRWMNPAGGVLASATDLAGFALALGGERLPGTAGMFELGDPLPADQQLPRRPDLRYGYGLRSWALDSDARAYAHSGNNVSFASELMFVPGRRAIVLLANCGAGLPASVAAAGRLLEAE